ncbi:MULTISPECIES: hypothetical protein [Chryseobacterium]|uniref:Lipoprotein n=1 Tax=Chryseobacterium camelliae TaxID=1265445 RepID=A0ABU0TJL4_9FLAO|nr:MULTISPECIES: hypothetical protein [Chryseobacterium]MDT3408914.1 hypothetical protein [Pseudacidovorax intermedius]MDQ1097229.1 hypothetical protein [Chryseobacterium camelliae]MDQ1101164.1 hypothetical protein [Chryseobacterium sp. SORGH_AS_1048]MDR6084609.1 hypothetical protein [Chryseobacterium sp. SORGH_AS_0909]MDR6132881.1 hypothetical protein [Chryseobacterium sp. SORGH_AS_1175]
MIKPIYPITTLGIFSLFILTVSCKKNTVSAASAATPETVQKVMGSVQDTLVNNSGIYILYPGEKEADSLKKAMGEEQFYTVADDSNYYMSEISGRLKEKAVYTNLKTIRFPKEKFIFNKKDHKNNWIVIEYREGNQPLVFSLVDYYNRLDGNKKKSSHLSAIDAYMKNDQLSMTTMDINGDGKEDKIFSNKPGTGDGLFVFLNQDGGYTLELQSTNFSQDGGNQVSGIKKEGNGFSVTTDFPKGIDRYTYFIRYNKNFVIDKVVHEIDSWQDKKVQICTFNPKIVLPKPTDEIFSELIESEKKAHCTSGK